MILGELGRDPDALRQSQQALREQLDDTASLCDEEGSSGG
jgi:hypothetical protein